MHYSSSVTNGKCIFSVIKESLDHIIFFHVYMIFLGVLLLWCYLSTSFRAMIGGLFFLLGSKEKSSEYVQASLV